MRRAIVEYEGLSKNLVPVFKVLRLKDKGLTNIKGKVLEIGVNAMIYLGKVPPKIKPKYSLKEFAKVMKARLQSEGYTKLPQKEIKSHANFFTPLSAAKEFNFSQGNEGRASPEGDKRPR